MIRFCKVPENIFLWTTLERCLQSISTSKDSKTLIFIQFEHRNRTPCYEKGLCEHCCEHAMSDDDLREMVEFRGYKMTDRMTEAFEGKSDNFNKCMEKLLNISVLIEEFESGKLDSEKTIRLIKDIVEAPVYP